MLLLRLIGLTSLILAATMLQQVESQPTISNCKNNFSLVHDKCLLAVSNWINWFEADRHCHSLGGALLSVESPLMLAELTNWISLVAPYSLELWTSGNSLGKKGSFYWQSTGAQLKYLPWAATQPQQANGDCLTLYTASSVQKDYRLKVRNCLNMEPYVCEHAPQKTSQRLCLNSFALMNATILL